MFSYLHGMRPSNRRSTFGPVADPQQVASSRRYHEGPLPSPDLSFDPIPPRTPDDGSIHEPSPISADPPILPPIPRIASRLESHGEIDAKDEAPKERGPIRLNAQSRPCKRPPFVASRSVVDDDGYTESMAESTAEDYQHRTLESTVPPRPSISPEQYRHVRHHQPPPQSAVYESMRSYSEPPKLPRPRAKPPEILSVPQPQQAPPRPPSQPSSLKLTQPEISITSMNTVRHGKTKLNLLNPLSLLAKRRSFQAVAEPPLEKYPPYKSPVPCGMRLPDDYDPRIRGKVVHDFSAPRPGSRASKQHDPRGFMPPKLSPNSSASLVEDDSPSSTEREHAPVFKEHFEDDIEPWKAGQDAPTKRRTSAFLYQVSLAKSQPDPDSSSLPPFARNLPLSLSTSSVAALRAPSPPPRKAPSPPRVSLAVLSEPVNKESFAIHKPASTSPPSSPSVIRSQSTSNSDSLFQPAGLPKHFKSNASRFSFDLAGVGSSAQEKVLEEKHRQKARQKARTNDASGRSGNGDLRNDDEDDENYDDYDDMDHDDGFEEPIPGVNADADPIGHPVSTLTLDGFEFVSPTKSSFTSRASPMSTELTSPDTPRDNQSQVNSFAFPKLPPDLGVDQGFPELQQSQERDNLSPVQNNNDIAIDHGIHSHPPQLISGSKLPSPPPRPDYEDDDLYFDDGMIDDLNNTDGRAFDESVFDDETSRIYGLPLRDLKPLGASNDTSAEGEQPPIYALQQEHEPLPIIQRGLSEVDFAKLESRNSVIDLPHAARPAFCQTAGLTQDNLSAYHDALAFAANQAAINGQFVRRQSDVEPLPGMIPDEDQMSREVDGLPGNEAIEDTDDFGFDDALADDHIIAAANAEALENDDDGFYGQEFGFFAHAADSGEAQYANGGYFGPRGIEGLGRSRSGRVNFQEPSLTPITERSEWSNRNSAISLAMHGYPLQPVSTQGLAQLTDMMHLDEVGDMSLSALMKLRRGAWGGSNSSLQSSSSGSPLTFLPPGIPPAAIYHSNNGSPIDGRNSFNASNYSLSSSQNIGSDSGDASPSSPTITLSTAQEGLVMAAPFMQAERSHSPVKRSAMPPTKGGHSRNSSGAESVSYVKETNEEGGRWVLEKRRTVEGQVEILGREVVEGGRI